MKTAIFMIAILLATSGTAAASAVTPQPDVNYNSSLTTHVLNVQSVVDGFMVAMLSWSFFATAGWVWRLTTNTIS